MELKRLRRSTTQRASDSDEGPAAGASACQCMSERNAIAARPGCRFNGLRVTSVAPQAPGRGRFRSDPTAQAETDPYFAPHKPVAFTP